MEIPVSGRLTSYKIPAERSNVESVSETRKYSCYATLS
jgi:hypothetical protein